jgi:HK97 gp10 family phage protein
MSVGKLTGMAQLLANIDNTNKKMKKNARQGLIKAGNKVHRQAAKNAPRDTGNLRASGFTYIKGGREPANMNIKVPAKGNVDTTALQEGFNLTKRLAKNESKHDLDLVVAFGAYYAIYVHELHSSNSKFLERAYKELQEKILDIIKKKIEQGLT